ncbi:F0F1 ATP synthase subunit delta [Candidatus Saccharibacteria bacterium]|nr:F0F1 ATP synthase subunit delta [Candidatus Saccharibacteria bacterium]
MTDQEFQDLVSYANHLIKTGYSPRRLVAKLKTVLLERSASEQLESVLREVAKGVGARPAVVVEYSFLTDLEKERIKARVAKQNRQVQFIHNPSLISGIKITDQAKIFDSSLEAKIQEMSYNLIRDKE